MGTPKNILVIGYFGYSTNQLDGQTIKTRNIYKLLQDNNNNVDYYDTQSFQDSKLSLFSLIYKILHYKNIIIIPAGNALKFIFPFLFVISKLFFKNVVLIPVGGWLSWYIKKKKVLIYMLKNIKAVLPQTAYEVDNLIRLYNMNNVFYFPNFRLSNFTPSFEHKASGLKLVYFARIHKMKGLDVVFYIANRLIKENPNNNILIDFYGQINEPDKEFFLENVTRYNNVSYKGVLEPNEIYDKLSTYDVMLFPTRYIEEEGFPGSILDGYMSGVPVIASNWRHSKEFVKDGYSGFICDIENLESFYEKVILLYNSHDRLFEMKKHAFKESAKYSGKRAYETIIHLIK